MLDVLDIGVGTVFDGFYSRNPAVQLIDDNVAVNTKIVVEKTSTDCISNYAPVTAVIAMVMDLMWYFKTINQTISTYNTSQLVEQHKNLWKIFHSVKA
jgi:hypothetical protein